MNYTKRTVTVTKTESCERSIVGGVSTIDDVWPQARREAVQVDGQHSIRRRERPRGLQIEQLLLPI